MNAQNLMNQLRNSTNPMALMSSILNPSQKQVASQFQNKTTQEQAEMIANKANELGLKKEDLQFIINLLHR